MKKKPGKVTIISRESNNKTLDIILLEDELKRRGLKVRTLTKLLTKEKSVKMLGYIGHILRQAASMLDSDVIVVDTYCIPISMLPHRKNLKVVQIWHAVSAVKKFGWQTVGLADGSSERVAKAMKMHRGYDYVACAGDITAAFFRDAFKVTQDKIVKLGLPRIDYIKNVCCGEEKKNISDRIFDIYPELNNVYNTDSETDQRRIILYAPTFRKVGAVDVRGLIEAIDPQKYDIVIKLHPIDRKRSEEVNQQNVIYDTHFRSYDWLSVADIVISDYSSLVIEATLADKPMYLYSYDIDRYRETTGLNIEFDDEPVAPYVFESADELAAALDLSYDMSALRKFRDRYIDIDTDNCTAALADFIESLIQREK